MLTNLHVSIKNIFGAYAQSSNVRFVPRIKCQPHLYTVSADSRKKLTKSCVYCYYLDQKAQKIEVYTIIITNINFDEMCYEE